MSAVPPGAVASNQWLRRCSLIVADASGNGLDLSQLRIKFRVEQADLSQAIPKIAIITVYNLADSTLGKILTEFTQVTLQAGYQPPGTFGIIFTGTIKQFERGHESVTESYLTIFAADGDPAHNFAVTNKTLAAGYTAQDQYDSHTQAMEPYGATPGYDGGVAGASGIAGGTGGLPQGLRGKLLLGPSAGGLNQLGQTQNFTWIIENGKIISVPLASYRPGQAVVLNAQSGLIGWPTNTQQGVMATCLLNPSLRVMGLVQINNRAINAQQPAKGAGIQGFPNASFGFPGFNSKNFPATVADDGFYRILVLEYVGDTRGNDWFCLLTLLAADLSAAAGAQVPTTTPTAAGVPE